MTNHKERGQKKNSGAAGAAKHREIVAEECFTTQRTLSRGHVYICVVGGVFGKLAGHRTAALQISGKTDAGGEDGRTRGPSDSTEIAHPSWLHCGHPSQGGAYGTALLRHSRAGEAWAQKNGAGGAGWRGLT
eukprot:gene12879-biopygen21518